MCWYCILKLSNLLIISNSFIVNFLGFPLYKIMSSVKRDSCTPSFPIWMTYTSFYYCKIVLARTSSKMLNGSSKSRHSCIVPDHMENVFNLLIEMFFGGLVLFFKMPFIFLSKFLSIPRLWHVLPMKDDWIFSTIF